MSCSQACRLPSRDIEKGQSGESLPLCTVYPLQRIILQYEPTSLSSRHSIILISVTNRADQCRNWRDSTEHLHGV